jgi:hypothetical protein
MQPLSHAPASVKFQDSQGMLSEVLVVLADRDFYILRTCAQCPYAHYGARAGATSIVNSMTEVKEFSFVVFGHFSRKYFEQRKNTVYN